MLFYRDGRPVLRGDRVRRYKGSTGDPETGSMATVFDVTDRTMILCRDDMRGGKTHKRDDGTQLSDLWKSNVGHYELVCRKEEATPKGGEKMSYVDGSEPNHPTAPDVFTVKGLQPKLVIKLGCKEFDIVGFRERAKKVKRLLSVKGTEDAEVRVMGESGLKPDDITGLLSWLDETLAKVK